MADVPRNTFALLNPFSNLLLSFLVSTVGFVEESVEFRPHMRRAKKDRSKGAASKAKGDFDSIFRSSRTWRSLVKKSYSRTYSKLSKDSQNIMARLKFIKSVGKIEDSTFAVLKAMYATVMSKYKITCSRRKWTHPRTLSQGYGTMTLGEVAETPKTLAYIMLLAVKGDSSQHFHTDELQLYAIYLSMVTSYINDHKSDIFFCASTQSKFTTGATKKRKNEAESPVGSASLSVVSQE